MIRYIGWRDLATPSNGWSPSLSLSPHFLAFPPSLPASDVPQVLIWTAIPQDIMLCLASAVVLVLRLLSAAPHPCRRCPASVSLVLRVMATFCPSPPPSTLKPSSTIYMTDLWFPVSSVETNGVWVIWRESRPFGIAVPVNTLSVFRRHTESEYLSAVIGIVDDGVKSFPRCWTCGRRVKFLYLFPVLYLSAYPGGPEKPQMHSLLVTALITWATALLWLAPVRPTGRPSQKRPSLSTGQAHPSVKIISKVARWTGPVRRRVTAVFDGYIESKARCYGILTQKTQKCPVQNFWGSTKLLPELKFILADEWKACRNRRLPYAPQNSVLYSTYRRWLTLSLVDPSTRRRTGNGCPVDGSTRPVPGRHGISLGSIASNVIVNNVHITGNTVMNNTNGLCIKTDATATASTVSNVVYTNNKLSGITQFGVLIDQSYPDTLGTPGTGVVITGVTFSGTNTISVTSGAKRMSVNCGSTSSCVGTWNFLGLTVTGGSAGTIRDVPVTGGSF
ncbi:hypothetical protein B0H10DRAFT_1955820 [Mycena sp. CBHHK59/15]|nr:hypothetical protein B0H10DRAFT_1955820 [Mycena sp. CBHHK59/15]